MKITIGSDHRGYELKEKIKQEFAVIGPASTDWSDVGTDSSEIRVDFPIFVKRVCENVRDKKSEFGIVICGSGVGVSIAANRYKGIYCSLCWNEEVARLAREHDNANVLALPANFVSHSEAIKIVDVWLKAKFLGGVYQNRLDLIDQI